jgi:hypothetical protein
LDGRAAILWSLRDQEETIVAGFVIGLPTGGRSHFLSVCDVPLPMGAPDADIRSGPFRCFHSRSSPVFVDFLPGLVYDLQYVAICASPEPVATSEAIVLFKIALTLLVAWLIGVLTVDSAGDFLHVLLLAGLASLLLAFLRAREAAIRRATSDPNQTP